MSHKYTDVIVFGPTGDVGGHTALEASKRGAKVWLAMRDPSKTISEIPSDVEKSGAFARVQADLTDVASVAKAVKKSGAKAAYIYLIFTPDFSSLRASLQAMHDAGIEYIVFLSSYAIEPNADLRKITQDEIIAFANAQLEIAVEEIGFPYFTSLRPAWFASNWFKLFLDKSSKPPKANFVYGDAFADNIVPEDIGAVSGAVLVERPQSSGKETVYLCGPEVKSFQECWETIKSISGRDDIDAMPSSGEEFVGRMVKGGAPEFIAAYMNYAFGVMREAEKRYPDSAYKAAVANIKKYSGREPTKFADYVAAHKAEWQGL